MEAAEYKALEKRLDAVRRMYARMRVDLTELRKALADVGVTLEAMTGPKAIEALDRQQAMAEHEMAVHVERTLTLLRNGATDE